MTDNEKLKVLDEHVKNMAAICEQRIAAMKRAGIGDESQYQKMSADTEALIKMDIEIMFRPKEEVIKW